MKCRSRRLLTIVLCVVGAVSLVPRSGRAQRVPVIIPDANASKAIPKLDNPAVRRLRDELERAQKSAEAWAVSPFVDPLEETAPSRSDQIPALRRKRERRRNLAQRYLNEPLNWSGVSIKTGSMLSFFGELLGPTALKQSRQLRRFRDVESLGDLSPEDQERYAVLRDIHSAVEFPRELIQEIVFTRQIHGEPQTFSFGPDTTALALEPMPLEDWPSLLMDRVYASNRRRVHEHRDALINATLQLQSAEAGSDPDALEQATQNWVDAGEALKHSVDRLQTTYRKETTRASHTLNHASSDATRFLQRLRQSAARMIADRSIETIVFSPSHESESTSAETFSAVDLLAFVEENGLSFGRAHASSEVTHRQLANVIRNYYGHIWSLQEIERRAEDELRNVEAIIDQQQRHERHMADMVAVTTVAQAVIELAQQEREASFD